MTNDEKLGLKEDITLTSKFES